MEAKRDTSGSLTGFWPAVQAQSSPTFSRSTVTRLEKNTENEAAGRSRAFMPFRGRPFSTGLAPARSGHRRRSRHAIHQTSKKDI